MEPFIDRTAPRKEKSGMTHTHTHTHADTHTQNRRGEKADELMMEREKRWPL